ncbi:NAD(P)(+) transhydrogenase (Re/Si-specific) subunit beta [candidate division KSB1 bacterium]|nr:MAG: NAD(P)(+) transhydrogenase (Re/Si-specific) subunit beta [candidate division KSB1 bacterium]
MSPNLINLAYIVAAVLFIMGLKMLAHPRTAVKGNLLSAVGMLIAIVFTLWDRQIVSYEWIILGVLIGSAIGAVLALRIRMTAMPQMVALLNGFGGAASMLVAGVELMTAASRGVAVTDQFTIAVAVSGIIGAVTFWGSYVAFDKLQEWLLKGNPIHFPGQQPLNIALLVACVVVGVLIVLNPDATYLYWILVALASVLGVMFVLPVGGADMPVVICLLNSYSGMAGCATGFVINNNALIIAGALVGSSGIILSDIMCRAMNRSLMNVLLGVLGPTEGTPDAEAVYAGKIKSATAEEVAMLFDAASRVLIVPGYGLAVSQAQHVVRDLAGLLESRGVTVEYGIHPVAGRMPGHMNVLLAEADVPYDKLKEMDEVNATMSQTDVVLVVGANDVVNPMARTDPKCVIGGMPIIDVDKARTVVVIKRSLSPGFAGIPNPLFANDNTLMFFSDGKKAFLDLIAAVKES